MPSIYVCLSFCLCRPCHFFTTLIAFLRVIQNSVYCSSLFLFILLLVHILWTVPKVYCTYWLTSKLCLMLEDYYNLFIKQTHINYCVWKTKYAYIPKGIIFAWFCSTFYIKTIFTLGCFCKSTLVIFCWKNTSFLWLQSRVVFAFFFGLWWKQTSIFST